MNETARREVLRLLLLRWQERLVAPIDVLTEAEALWEKDPLYGQYVPFLKNDPRSIYYAVLHMLEVLHVKFVLREDIPAFLAFLDTPIGQEEAAWTTWERHWDSIDYDRRKEIVYNSHYYEER